jgi:hypothetical protein
LPDSGHVGLRKIEKIICETKRLVFVKIIENGELRSIPAIMGRLWFYSSGYTFCNEKAQAQYRLSGFFDIEPCI